MESRDPVDQLLSGRMDRRTFHNTLGALGIGVATMPLAPGVAVAQEEEANFFTWAGYELPEFHQQYLDKYQASPNITFFAGTTEAKNKIVAGYKTDIGHPCSGGVTEWYAAGIIVPFDTDRLKHWPDYFEALRTIGTTLTEEGENLFIPFDWGNSSILYRTDLVEMEEESWSLLFDPRYKGKLATYDSPQAGVQVAAQVLGFTNLESLSDEQLLEVRKLLEQQRDVLRFYWESQSEAGQAMVAGELVATYAWNDLYKTVADQGLPVKYMSPKEGGAQLGLRLRSHRSGEPRGQRRACLRLPGCHDVTGIRCLSDRELPLWCLQQEVLRSRHGGGDCGIGTHRSRGLHREGNPGAHPA